MMFLFGFITAILVISILQFLNKRDQKRIEPYMIKQLSLLEDRVVESRRIADTLDLIVSKILIGEVIK